MGMGNSCLIFSWKGYIIELEVRKMSETVATRSTINEVFWNLFQAEEFRIRYANGIAFVVPMNQPENPMLGFFSDGSNGTQATDDFMRRKQEEKELEL
jgi:hypothetical protein